MLPLQPAQRFHHGFVAFAQLGHEGAGAFEVVGAQGVGDACGQVVEAGERQVARDAFKGI